jgi:hypothetical protein
MKLISNIYPGWNQYPAYTISKYNQEEFDELFRWCRQMQVETFSLSFGGGQHTFQVETNHELFVLKWL